MEIVIAIIPTIVIPVCILHVLLNVKQENLISVSINGVLILLGVICEVKVLYHFKDDWTISVIIAGIVFIALTTCCVLDYLDMNKEQNNDKEQEG